MIQYRCTNTQKALKRPWFKKILWPIAPYTIHATNQAVPKFQWKQTDRRSDGHGRIYYIFPLTRSVSIRLSPCKSVLPAVAEFLWPLWMQCRRLRRVQDEQGLDSNDTERCRLLTRNRYIVDPLVDSSSSRPINRVFVLYFSRDWWPPTVIRRCQSREPSNNNNNAGSPTGRG